MWFLILFLIHAVIFPSSFGKMKKPILPLYTATSHAQSLHCTGMNQDLSPTSQVIKPHSGFLDSRKDT